MLQNYFKIAIRTITRSPSYTVINVSGLSLGITCAILIFSIIYYHLSFDNFHQNTERIYRFVTEQHRDQVSYVSSVPPAFGLAFRNDYTFGEKVARICNLSGHLLAIEENGNTKKFKEDLSFAEPDFFQIFNFPIVAGQSQNVLAEPNTAIISERMAKKYFGNQSPLNKTFRFVNNIDFKIVGVLKDIPDNTDFRSEIYLSYSTIGKYSEWYGKEDAWGGITTEIQTFVRLRPRVTTTEVETVLPAYVKKYRAESKNVHHYKLQPIDDVHFNPQYQGVMSKTNLGVLGMIGLFLIITAALNFINLATAQAVNRSREIGVRKALGSARIQLFWQFTIETSVIVILSSVLAFCIAYAILPYVNTLFNTRVSLNPLADPSLILFIATLTICVTFLSGSYPGLILSGFKPVAALKGKLSDQDKGNFNLRRGLITAQFTIAQILLIGLIVIVYQLDYFKQTDMGFNQEAVIMIPLASHDAKAKTLKDQFVQIPNVVKVTQCFAAPASNSQWGTLITFDNRTETEAFAVSFKGADEDFISTFELGLVAGRNLWPSDTVREFLVNEVLVGKLNLSSPEEILGKTISMQGGEWQGPVVGVVRDFHDQSFRSAMNPVIFTTSLDNYNEYAVKINMVDASTTLAALEKAWSAMYPEELYEYEFLDQQTARFYEAEQNILQLIQVFSFIALFIGCMGLYGLVSFMAVQKNKEIGIRKVLGGSIAHILWIFGREFFRLILIAFMLAAPFGWWIMSRWLENYEYAFDITWWVFAIEILIISFLCLLTIGFRSAKAALTNPVNSLRTE
jgi:ABC-type antimicrobial peptide transport system permease subunit